MVTDDVYGRRQKLEYSLPRVRELAREKQIVYVSRKVQRDISNLGYTMDDVCTCLASLQDGDYRESLQYAENSPWLDVYRKLWSGCDTGQLEPDSLYIKLKLNRDCTTVVIMSFHRDGAL